MLYPSINKIRTKVDSRYTLVILAAKRARDIIEGMPKLTRLNALVGKYVNLEYRLPSGRTVKFLDDNATYLGNQLESEFGGDRCFGILANMDFIMVCTYEKNGENPELLIYKKR